jgi:hypothetical protein
VPRLVTGRIVLQRETWRIAGKGLVADTPAAAFRTLQRLRRDLDLPRHVFVKLADQPKPVYCDLNSPLLVRSLTGHEDIELSEMLPGPDHLWWDTDGGRGTSELRYTVFSGPRVAGV